MIITTTNFALHWFHFYRLVRHLNILGHQLCKCYIFYFFDSLGEVFSLVSSAESTRPFTILKVGHQHHKCWFYICLKSRTRLSGEMPNIWYGEILSHISPPKNENRNLVFAFNFLQFYICALLSQNSQNKTKLANRPVDGDWFTQTTFFNRAGCIYVDSIHPDISFHFFIALTASDFKYLSSIKKYGNLKWHLP